MTGPHNNDEKRAHANCAAADYLKIESLECNPLNAFSLPVPADLSCCQAEKDRNRCHLFFTCN